MIHQRNVERLISRCESVLSGKNTFVGQEWKLSRVSPSNKINELIRSTYYYSSMSLLWMGKLVSSRSNPSKACISNVPSNVYNSLSGTSIDPELLKSYQQKVSILREVLRNEEEVSVFTVHS